MATLGPTPLAKPTTAELERLREQGLRPVQIWVADTRAEGFVEEAHRQSAAVPTSPHADDDQAFIDVLSLDEE